jgi:putative ABC transport system substrate-binding protein
MNRRRVLPRIAAATLILLDLSASRAQSTSGPTVIGLLDAGERREWWDVFRRRLRDLGYVEGRNVAYEARHAKGKLDALPAMANELVRLKVAAIVTAGAAATVAAQSATTRIPIVMATGSDPVSLGVATSLNRPGGNVTGISSLNSDLMVKRFELLREVVPRSSRLAVLWHSENTSSRASVRDLDRSAAKERVELRSFGIKGIEGLADAFSAMTRDRVEAVVVVNSPLLYGERAKIAELATRHRLPAMYGTAEFVEVGGLIAYAPSYPDMVRRAADYLDRILRGANPGDLPIEQPSTFELTINAGAARAIGLTMPPSILSRADRVIQ